MPSEPRSICQHQEVKQQSTGQAGPEVNRDLEVIFRRLNQMGRCQAGLAEWVNSSSGGSFGAGNGGAGGSTGGGTGGTGGGVGGVGGTGGLRPGGSDFIRLPSWTSSFTVPLGFNGLIVVDPGASLTISLNTPLPDTCVQILHAGPASPEYILTINDDAAAAIGSLRPGMLGIATCFENTGIDPSWPSNLLIVAQNGQIILTQDVVIDDNTYGVIIRSPNGNYQRLTIRNTGQLEVFDLGAIAPVSL
jgi:hypothetical protein